MSSCFGTGLLQGQVLARHILYLRLTWSLSFQEFVLINNISLLFKPGHHHVHHWPRPTDLLTLGPGFFRVRYKPSLTSHFALGLSFFRIRQYPPSQVFFFGPRFLQPIVLAQTHITSSLGPGYSRVRVGPRHSPFVI